MNLPEINFNELNIKEIGLWQLPLRLIVLAIIAVITLIAGYLFILKSELNNLETQRTLNTTKRKEFQDKYNLAANLDAYQKQMEQIKVSYKESLKELPASDELPSLIENISEQAQACGLTLQTLKPGDPKTVLGFYNELPIELVLQGTYAGFGTFISDISKIPRIITIHDFSIKKSSDKGNPNSDQLILEVNAKTYWLSNDKQPLPSADEPKSSKSSSKASTKAGAAPGMAPAPGALPGAVPGAMPSGPGGPRGPKGTAPGGLPPGASAGPGGEM